MTNSLTHYGIRGMKWGVRRFQPYSKGETSKGKFIGKRRVSGNQDINPVKKMSDTELRSRINRLQMEKQYSQLTKKEKSSGQKIVTEIITNSAKQMATSYVIKYGQKGVENMIKKAKK